MTGNITGITMFTNKSIGGGRSVIDQTHITAKVTNGAIVENPFAVGGVIFEGDLGEYNFSTKKVKHLRVYKLAVAITDASTVLKFYKNDFTHVPNVGDVIIVAPSDMDGSYLYTTVTSVSVGTVSQIGEVYEVPITAGVFGSGVSIAKDTLFINGAAIGSIEAYTVAAAGADYVVGDLITAVSTGAEKGVFKVETIVAETGAIATVSQVSKGTGYKVAATQLATTTDSVAGAGAKIVVSAIGASVYAKPNVAFSTDIPFDYAASSSFTTPDGAIYNAPLYNMCSLLKSKASPIPTAIAATLRTGAFTDIKLLG